METLLPHFFLFSFILDIALAVRWAASFGSIRFRGVILSKWRFVAGCAWCSLCCCEWLICGELCQNPTILNSKPPEIASHNRTINAASPAPSYSYKRRIAQPNRPRSTLLAHTSPPEDSGYPPPNPVV